MVYEEGEKAVEVHVAASLLVDHVDDRSDFARGEEWPNVLESAADHLHARHAVHALEKLGVIEKDKNGYVLASSPSWAPHLLHTFLT